MKILCIVSRSKPDAFFRGTDSDPDLFCASTPFTKHDKSDAVGEHVSGRLVSECLMHISGYITSLSKNSHRRSGDANIC